MRFTAWSTIRWLPLVASALLTSAACEGHLPRPGDASSPPAPLAPLPPRELSASFGASTPEAEGVDPAALMALADWIRDQPSLPIYSILISRHGKLIFELYTSGLRRDDAHYLMSVTKSFTGAAVGIAIDQHLLPDPETPIALALPHSLFPSDAAPAQFQGVSIRDVLGMSALDAPVPPHQTDREARERMQRFLDADNRTAFALTQPLLPQPGTSFLYTDITPLLATGMVQYAAHTTTLDFLNRWLFGPLGFAHQDWMHQDSTGIDNGAYGLRLRPLDMQKFGILYLDGGAWNGTQLVSSGWVQRSFTPWIRSRPELAHPNYGWYWWTNTFGPGWTVREANGWKGQRILVIPEQQLVITTTACLEQGSGEDRILNGMVRQFIVPATGPPGVTLPPSPDADAALAAKLAEVRAGPSRIRHSTEARMIPSPSPKEPRRPFSG